MPSEKSDLSTAPLSTAAQYILLALAACDLHGYGIIQEITRLSEGSYRAGPGTLYDNLKKLMNSGLVVDAPPGDSRDDRRFYRITAQGRKALASPNLRVWKAWPWEAHR